MTARRMTALVGLVLLVFATVALAAPQRARLSQDLANELATPTRATLDVIVAGDKAAIDTLAARYGATVKHALKGGAVLRIAGQHLDALSQDPAVSHLSGDVPVRGSDLVTYEATGALAAAAGIAQVPGVTGQGIGVAVIDSGISKHKALRDRIVASVDFTGRGSADDRYGHGTHVAGIIAAASAQFPGIAPDVWLVNLKALDDDGSGETSDVIAAIDWAIDNAAQFHIRVINLSLGHPVFESYKDDPLCAAVAR
ncbi:MAG: S8 family serine peptidase, partial [Bacteroidales bacterium]